MGVKERPSCTTQGGPLPPVGKAVHRGRVRPTAQAGEAVGCRLSRCWRTSSNPNPNPDPNLDPNPNLRCNARCNAGHTDVSVSSREHTLGFTKPDGRLERVLPRVLAAALGSCAAGAAHMLPVHYTCIGFRAHRMHTVHALHAPFALRRAQAACSSLSSTDVRRASSARRRSKRANPDPGPGPDPKPNPNPNPNPTPNPNPRRRSKRGSSTSFAGLPQWWIRQRPSSQSPSSKRALA